MENLITNIVNMLLTGIMDAFRSMLCGIANLFTNILLSAFTFATPAQMESHFPGIAFYMDGLKIVGCAIVILIAMWSFLQYMVSPGGSSDSAGTLLARFFLSIFLVINSDGIIKMVLEYGNMLYQKILGEGITEESFSTAISNLFDADIGTVAFNATAFVSAETFFLALLCLMAAILLWNFFKVWLQLFERFANFAVQLYLCPVTVCALASSASQAVFTSYFRCVISQLALVVLDAWFIKVFINGLVLNFASGLLSANIFISCLFMLGYLKVVQNAEQMLRGWGLFAMTSGNMVRDIGEMMSAYRSVGQAMTGQIPGFGGASGGMRGGSTLGLGGILGATAKASSYIKNHAPSVSGAMKGAANAASGVGGFVGGIAGTVTGKGFKNGMQSGSAKVQQSLRNMAGKASSTNFAKASGKAVSSIKAGTAAAKNWTAADNSRAAKMVRGALKGAGVGGTLGGAAGLAAGGIAGAAIGARSPDIKVGNPSTAGEIRDAARHAGKARSMADEQISRIDAGGLRSYQKKDFMPCVNGKESIPARFDKNQDMEKQARSVFGDRAVNAAKAQGMGAVVGGSFNADSGVGTLTFQKEGTDGVKKQETMTCYAMSGDANYRAAHELASMEPGKEQFCDSTGADGNEFVCYRGEDIPKAMQQQSKEYLKDARKDGEDPEETQRVYDAVEAANAAYASNPDNMARFLQRDENGFSARPTDELMDKDSGAYEALENWADSLGIPTDGNPETLAKAFAGFMEKKYHDKFNFGGDA